MSRRSKQLTLAVLLALLIHGVFFQAIWLLPEPHGDFSQVQNPSKIQVHLAPTPKKQLVQIPPPKTDQIPRTADRLSEFNSRVNQETQAHNKSPILKPPSRPKAPSHEQAQKGPGSKHNLLPTWKDLPQSPETATAFNDDLSELKESAETQLNAFEWKHAAYFNRIKEGVSRNWAPMWQIKHYDPAGALIGKQNRLTVLDVTIDSSGNLLSTEIKTSSGVFYLDDEALKAFRQASPFPNPPKVLFAERDRYSFQFGFMVSLQRGLSLDFD